MNRRNPTSRWTLAGLALALFGLAYLAWRGDTSGDPTGRADTEAGDAANSAADVVTVEAGPGRARVESEEFEQTAATDPPPSARPLVRTRIHGLVIDLQGQAVADVLVANDPGQWAPPGIASMQRVRSDAAGHFEMFLEGAVVGHLTDSDGDWITVFEPELWGLQGLDTPELTLVVARPVRLGGVVVDAVTPAPLDGVDVHVTAELPSPAGFEQDLSRSRKAEWRTKSNPDGGFDLPVGRFPGLQIHAALPGYEHQHKGVEQISSRLRIEMQPSGAVLHGLVLDAAGEPAAGAAVLCGAATDFADDSGRFSLDLTHVHEIPGSDQHRLLIAARQGSVPGRLLGPETGWKSAAAWPSPLIVRLGGSPLAINGRVTEADGRPVEGVQVRAVDEEDLGPGRTAEMLARVQISREQDWISFMELDGGGDPGSFHVAGLQQRAYRLRVEDRRGMRSLLTAPVEAGTHDLVIRIPAEPMWPSVGGVLVDRDGRPAPGCSIRLSRSFAGEDSSFHLDTQLRSDDEGRFRTDCPVVQQGAHLFILPRNGAQELDFDLALQDDASDLRLVIPRVVKARILATPLSRTASEVRFLDAAGKVLTVVVRSGGEYTARPILSLDAGVSPVFEVLDSAAEVVLRLSSGEEIHRQVELRTAGDGGALELNL